MMPTYTLNSLIGHRLKTHADYLIRTKPMEWSLDESPANTISARKKSSHHL